MTKQMVWVEVDIMRADGSVDDFIKWLKKYSSDVGNYRINECIGSGGDYYYAIKEERLETDSQYNHRINIEGIQERNREQREHQEYLRLKEKFKDDV